MCYMYCSPEMEYLPQWLLNTNIFRGVGIRGLHRGGSRGGSLGSNEPPFLQIHLTYWLFVTPSSVRHSQRWHASPVWLLYNLRAIQFNVHAKLLLTHLHLNNYYAR